MNKGFTLIELLAVIVILAIIALIATPIIMGIINDSKDSAKQRSLELYKNAIANKIATSQLTENPVEPGNLSSEFLQTIKYDGERISCTTNVLNTDGTIYLDGCSVGNSTKLYSYGKEVYVQVYKPTYYIWQTYPETAYLGDYIPETNSEVPPEGKTIYLGYNLYTYTWDQITVRDKDGNVVKVYTTAADYIRYVTGVVKGPIKYEEGILNEDNTFTIYKGTEYEATYNSYETWQAFKATFGTDEVMTFEDRGGVLYPVQKQKTR